MTQLQPITVIFTIEGSIPTVVERLRHGARLRVLAYDREQRRKLADGTETARSGRAGRSPSRPSM